MTTATGYVQRLILTTGNSLVCIWVGPSPTSAESLFIRIKSSDSVASVAFKRGLITVLADAQVTGREVHVEHPDGSAEVTTVETPTSDVNVLPLQVDGLEITQAVQDLSQSVPLVAGKRTIVRLYLSYYASPGVTVLGQIAVRRAPSDPPVTIPSLNIVVLDPAQAGNLPVKRNDITRSLNFELPNTHTAAGPLAISISNITNVVTGISMAAGSERRPTVWFHDSPPLRVRVLGLQYKKGTPAVTYTPSNLDFQALHSWLGRAYPVGQVIWSQAVIDATAAPDFECNDANAQLAAIRALDMSAGGDQRTHYYGVVSDGGFFMRGCSSGPEPPQMPDPSTVASGPTGPKNWGWDNDGSYGDWYGGHELAHTFGRRHPGFCGETTHDFNNFPYANGQLASSDATFVGFDAGDLALGLSMAALPGTQWHDIMTYCTFQWFSAYTYQGVRLRLLAEDSSFGAGSGAGPALVASSAGRPDNRSPHWIIAQQREEEGPRKILVSVVATVNMTSSQGSIKFVNPVPNGRASALEPDSQVGLRVKRDNMSLADYPVMVKLSSCLLPGEDRAGLVDAVIAVDAEATAIQLLIVGQVADTFPVGGSLSSIRAVRRVTTDKMELRMALDLDRPLEQHITYSVQLSTDNGKTWQTVAVGLKEPSFTLDRSQIRGGQVRIIVTNGLSVVTSDTFPASDILADQEF